MADNQSKCPAESNQGFKRVKQAGIKPWPSENSYRNSYMQENDNENWDQIHAMRFIGISISKVFNMASQREE